MNFNKQKCITAVILLLVAILSITVIGKYASAPENHQKTIGSPGWQLEYLARELCYIKKLRPHMIGIGPFIPHKDTVFAKETGGSLDLTLNLVAMLRLMNPNAMIPATTAVGTIDPRGREKAILSGANVVMPNLSPVSVRKKYMLYDNKLCTGDEAAECRKCFDARIRITALAPSL